MKLDHLKKIYYCRNENSESLSVQRRSPKLIKMSKYPYLIKRATSTIAVRLTKCNKTIVLFELPQKGTLRKELVLR